MSDVTNENQFQKVSASKPRGYYIVVDHMGGEEFRLPEHLFIAVNEKGEDISPAQFNAAVLQNDLIVPNFRVKEIAEGDPAWAVAYVTVTEDGQEFIIDTNQSNFLVDSRWEQIGEAKDVDPGFEIATFRRIAKFGSR